MVKWGLGQSYDRVIISKKLRAYIDAMKPASTLGVMGLYFLSSLFYFLYVGNPYGIATHIGDIVLVCLTVASAHGASQAMNMAEDADMDRETPHKQNRPIPSGVISEEEARSVAWLGSGFALGASYVVSTDYGILMSILVFFGIFYNLNPIRAKERIISIPWQAVSRGLLSFPAVWAAYGDWQSPFAWTMGLFMFWYVLSYQNSADIIDRKIDEEYGIRTFVVEFGVKNTVKIAAVGTALMFVTLISGVNSGILPEYMLSLSAIFPLCIYMLYILWTDPYTVDDVTGNHRCWKLFYLGMVLSVLAPLITKTIMVFK
jgi:4-hydroxybenzoate polyprenyltransferase